MAWLTRIVRNSAIDWIRAQKRRQTTGDDELVFVADQSETAEEMLIRVEQCDNVRQQVENLASADADLIRSANEQGLLKGDWPAWRGYRDMRSKTSHTYDESVALQVVAEIPAFLQEARFLNTQLHSRNK